MVVDQEYENNIWQEMCKDPLYPCAKCVACQEPSLCHNKKCKEWRNWWSTRFAEVKEAAGVIKERSRRRW